MRGFIKLKVFVNIKCNFFTANVKWKKNFTSELEYDVSLPVNFDAVADQKKGI